MKQNEVPQWYEVTRSIQQLDADQLRSIADDVPGNLDDCTLLLVKRGNEPVKEYIYGMGDGIGKAGELAGFAISPLPDNEDPELPDMIRRSSHALVPWRARLNSKATMEKMRTDASGIRKSVEASMPPDSYVSVTLRKQGYFEQMRIRDWVADEHSTVEDGNELVAAHTLCARVTVGCADSRQNNLFAQRVGQAVFPLLSNMSSHPSHPRLGGFLAAIAVTLLTVLLSIVTPIRMQTYFWLAGFSLVMLFVPWLLSGLLSGNAKALLADDRSTRMYFRVPPHYKFACLGLFVYFSLMLLPVPVWAWIVPLVISVGMGLRWWQNTLWDDILQCPRRYWWLRRKRKANVSDTETKLGVKDKRVFATGYGPQRTTLIFSPMTTTALFVPIQKSTAVKQELHAVPEPLSHGGVFLGVDDSGRSGYLDPTQLFGGIAISGEAGSGKTVLTHGISQWAIKHRADTSPKVWGTDSRLIHFWMKDDTGVELLDAYKKDQGITDKSRVIYLTDPSSVGLDMLGMHENRNAKETAESVAKTMRYSFNPGDIQNDSQNIITQAMTIGVAASRYDQRHPGDILRRCHQLEKQYPGSEQLQQQRSPIGWAVVALCGSDGQAGSARALGQVCRALALEMKDDNPLRMDLVYASRAAEQLYGRPDQKGQAARSDREILQRTNASVNKVNQFLAIDHMFTPRRSTVTWEWILDHPGDYHIVLAPHNGHALPELMDKILGSWILYRFWNTVFAHCKDWAVAGKHTMLVCDELSLLSNGSDDVLQNLREQGRSFGLILVFATQYPTQLSDVLLDSFLGYTTFISYNTAIPRIASLTAARLTDNEGMDGWTSGAVANLPKYHAAVRTRDAEQIQPAFIVKVKDFDVKYRRISE